MRHPHTDIDRELKEQAPGWQNTPKLPGYLLSEADLSALENRINRAATAQKLRPVWRRIHPAGAALAIAAVCALLYIGVTYITRSGSKPADFNQQLAELNSTDIYNLLAYTDGELDVSQLVETGAIEPDWVLETWVPEMENMPVDSTAENEQMWHESESEWLDSLSDEDWDVLLDETIIF